MDDEEKKQEEAKRKAEEEAEAKRKAEADENQNAGAEGEKNPLDEAKEINEKKEELLAREEKLIERKEKLAAIEAVGGRSQGGQPIPKETEDEQWAKGAKERYKGTGMSPVEGDDGE